MDNRQRLLDYIDAHQEELTSILTELVKCDTQNFSQTGREENGQVRLAELCRERGLTPVLYCPDDVPGLTEHPGYLAGRGTDKRPNLSAVLPAEKPERRVTLAAHMDTVPIGDEEQWTVPPLGGIVKDGRLYGRGSGDDKSGLAVGLFLLGAIRKLGIRLKDELVLTAYVDEEYGGGNGSLATCLKYPSDLYLNLDGTGMKLSSWGVGGCVYIIDVYTEDAVEDGRYALDGVMVLVDELKKFGERRSAELQANSVYAGTHEAETALRFMEISVGNNGNDLGHGMINFVFYTLDTEANILAELKEVREKAIARTAGKGLRFGDFTPGSRFFLPYVPDAASADAVRIGNYVEQFTGEKAVHSGMCLSDLAIFGPFGGSTAFNFGIDRPFSSEGGAHQPDEYVSVDDLVAEAKILGMYLMDREA